VVPPVYWIIPSVRVGSDARRVPGPLGQPRVGVARQLDDRGNPGLGRQAAHQRGAAGVAHGDAGAAVGQDLLQLPAGIGGVDGAEHRARRLDRQGRDRRLGRVGAQQGHALARRPPPPQVVREPRHRAGIGAVGQADRAADQRLIVRRGCTGNRQQIDHGRSGLHVAHSDDMGGNLRARRPDRQHHPVRTPRPAHR
jgi:hypothetical protein